MSSNSSILHKWFPAFLIIGILLNATGLFSYILEPDGALYAGIAKRIAVTNDWINLYAKGGDWLDKPHFPFWLTALSFKLFGISSFAYKLPAFIFWLAGIYILFIFIKQVYNKATAELSTLIYVIAAHAVISNFDVRAEPYLTTVFLGALYFLYRYQKTRRLNNIIWAAVFTACSIMTKGIFILIPLAGALILYLFTTKQWKEFGNTAWYIYILLTGLFILPELYCLFVQFDMHPEKIVYGRTHVSGLRFFFWDSQFGRFFNTGPIKGKGNPFFFVHTILWAFLPWTVVLCMSVFNIFRKLFHQPKDDLLIKYSALITFLLFSFSGFQLPHYIIIIFPQLAALSADYLLKISNKLRLMNVFIKIQSIMLYIISIAVILIAFFFNLKGQWFVFVFIILLNIIVIIPLRNIALINFLKKSFCMSLIVHLFLNLFFYPQLGHYESGMQAARWSNKNDKHNPVAVFPEESNSLEFYSNKEVTVIPTLDSLNNFVKNTPGALIYTAENNLQSLKQQGIQTNIVKQFDFYPVSKLNFKFINYKTRSSAISKVDLLQCKSEPNYKSVATE
ncbi:MAG TPA: glycosyltransferase family 39 protein [Parafilimonas sp.]|nr:glycosyltransferase family 39 protein [Parafilimonas sp.]